jgi:hypothetical protein
MWAPVSGSRNSAARAAAHHGFLFPGDDLGGLADDGLAQVVVPAAQALVALRRLSMVRTRGSNSWRSMGLVRKSLAPARGSRSDFLLVGGGDHQDRDAVGRVELAQGADEVDAVDVGHHVVDDEQVGLVAGRTTAALRGAGRR